ncbi:hypothetical protein [Lacticaseibacillus nasuensis]|nr:hypothetical protein [Lacticaseibacillus nasuensis]
MLMPQPASHLLGHQLTSANATQTPSATPVIATAATFGNGA